LVDHPVQAVPALVERVDAVPQLHQALAADLSRLLFGDFGHQIGECGLSLPASELAAGDAHLRADLLVGELVLSKQLRSP
jgi:hypothetical protein